MAEPHMHYTVVLDIFFLYPCSVCYFWLSHSAGNIAASFTEWLLYTQPYLRMEVEVTFLLLRNVVYDSHWNDPYGHAILIKKKHEQIAAVVT